MLVVHLKHLLRPTPQCTSHPFAFILLWKGFNWWILSNQDPLLAVAGLLFQLAPCLFFSVIPRVVSLHAHCIYFTRHMAAALWSMCRGMSLPPAFLLVNLQVHVHPDVDLMLVRCLVADLDAPWTHRLVLADHYIANVLFVPTAA